MRRIHRGSHLRARDTIVEAVAAITQRPMRTLLTALGTILGVGAFITTTGLASTASAQVSSRFDALRATEVRVQDATPDGTNAFPSDVDQRLEMLAGVNFAGIFYTIIDDGSIRPRNSANEGAGVNDVPIPLVAASPGAIQASLPSLVTGRLYDDWHQRRGERVALLGRVAADQLGITRIDNQPAVFIEDVAYAVVGIIDDVARNPDLLLAVVIPTSTAEAEFDTENAQRQVVIDTDPGAAQLVGRQAPIALRPQEPQRLQALVPPDPRTLRQHVEGDVQSLFYALSGLALLVGAVAITNATLLNVTERRPEIGLRRALGATRMQIARQITIEAALTGSIAGILGGLLGMIAILVTSFSRQWKPTVDLLIVAAAPVIGVLTGALAGFGPALKAARTPPADTLRA